MATVEICSNLRALADKLGELRTATPVTDPGYAEVERRYREASDLLEQANQVAVDDADREYLEFTAEMERAIAAITEAKAKLGRVSKAISVAARVIDIAGKIISKCA